MSIKLNFQKLTIFQKIEVYLLVIMFYGSILYFFDDMFLKLLNKKPDNSIQNQKILKYHNNIKLLKSKVIKKDTNILVKLLEEKSIEFITDIKSAKIEKKYIIVEFMGKFINVMNFLNYCENYLIIEDIKLVQDKRDILCSLKINIEYFYNQNKINNQLIEIANPFINKIRDINRSIIKYKFPKISAIVSQDVCIDNQWYKTNDVIENYKIIRVDFNSIELLNIKTNKKSILRLNDE